MSGPVVIDGRPVALVTGASRGIGAAVAVALAAKGIVPVLAVRDPTRCGDVVRAIEAGGRPVSVATCDIGDAGSVANAVEVAIGTWGRLDIVVNNAGQIDPIARIADASPDEWARSLQVNLLGHFLVTRAALPHLTRSTRPVIVNISSGAAHGPREGWSAYCSAKAGLAMFTRCIAGEHPRIAVYGLQPGVVDTAMQVRIRASGVNEISRIPREKLASASRPAACVAWLCHERPVDLIGQDLSIADPALLARFEVAHRSLEGAS